MPSALQLLSGNASGLHWAAPDVPQPLPTAAVLLWEHPALLPAAALAKSAQVLLKPLALHSRKAATLSQHFLRTWYQFDSVLSQSPLLRGQSCQ